MVGVGGLKAPWGRVEKNRQSGCSPYVTTAGLMDGEKVEIEGKVFDLGDPEEKKAAIRAWLKAKSRTRDEQEPGQRSAEGTRTQADEE